MDRRKFIRNTSLATAGGLLAGGLPAWASAAETPQPRVVLVVLAGISRADFVQLFPKTHPDSLGSAGHLINDMQYGGQAAGHRLALESILKGEYVPENRSGQTSVLHTPLFADEIPGRKFLIGADREFLKSPTPSVYEKATHLCVETKQPPGGDYPRAFLKNVDVSRQQRVALYQARLDHRRVEHEIFPAVTEDWYISETAGHVLELDAPTVTVAHFMGADAAHFDVALAQKNREEIRWGLQRLWEKLCAHPPMQNTLFVAVPDFGRNATPNGIKNPRGEYGSDHSTADENTRQIACLLASPKGLPKNLATSGETVDILPTLLRHLNRKPAPGLPGKSLL